MEFVGFPNYGMIGIAPEGDLPECPERNENANPDSIGRCVRNGTSGRIKSQDKT